MPDGARSSSGSELWPFRCGSAADPGLGRFRPHGRCVGAGSSSRQAPPARLVALPSGAGREGQGQSEGPSEAGAACPWTGASGAATSGVPRDRPYSRAPPGQALRSGLNGLGSSSEARTELSGFILFRLQCKPGAGAPGSSWDGVRGSNHSSSAPPVSGPASFHEAENGEATGQGCSALYEPGTDRPPRFVRAHKLSNDEARRSATGPWRPAVSAPAGSVPARRTPAKPVPDAIDGGRRAARGSAP